jgi:hypothetical protein
MNVVAEIKPVKDIAIAEMMRRAEKIWGLPVSKGEADTLDHLQDKVFKAYGIEGDRVMLDTMDVLREILPTGAATVVGDVIETTGKRDRLFGALTGAALIVVDRHLRAPAHERDVEASLKEIKRNIKDFRDRYAVQECMPR